jgi:ABC-type cobalamin/Fe3+-siderophores transport system ATPase subunit
VKIDKFAFVSGSGPGKPGLEIWPNRIVLFIGPNNGGKSRALAEIQQYINPTTNFGALVVNYVKRSNIESDEFDSKLIRVRGQKQAGDDPSLSTVVVEMRGARVLLNVDTLKSHINNNSNPSMNQYVGNNFLRHFYINLGGSNRLALTNKVEAQPVRTNAKTTISALLNNDSVREELSDIVFKAFNQYLAIDPTQMPQIQYKLVSQKPENGVEKRFDDHSLDFFNRGMALADASDGTKAFIGILAEVMAGDPDIVFIDEPEAFLHPSLQYLLGQQIAEKASAGKQVYAATHSPSFLLGCVLSGAEVDVVRLTHRSGNATARHLDSSRIKTLMTDPLFRSVGASNALFFESAVVVEGDSDRAFYEEVNTRLLRFEDRGVRHASFLNAHNKQTAVNIVKPLREIGIPAASILDIDWIKEDGQVWDRYFSAMGAPSGLKESIAMARRSVRASFEKKFIDFKRHGGINLLDDEERLAAEAFFSQCDSYGLFTVRSGELESWLPSLQVERTKSKWLASIFASMGSDPDQGGYLKPSSDDVWDFLCRIAEWAADPNRLGMAS